MEDKATNYQIKNHRRRLGKANGTNAERSHARSLRRLHDGAFGAGAPAGLHVSESLRASMVKGTAVGVEERQSSKGGK